MGIDCGFARVYLWDTKSLARKKFQETTMNQKRRTKAGNWKRDIGSTWNISKNIPIYM